MTAIESESGSVAMETVVVVVIVSVLIIVGGVISIVLGMLCCKRQKPRPRTETCKGAELGAQQQPWYLQPTQQQTSDHQQQSTLFQQAQPTVGTFQDTQGNQGNQDDQVQPTHHHQQQQYLSEVHSVMEYPCQHQSEDQQYLMTHRPHGEQYVQYYVQQQQYLQEQYIQQHRQQKEGQGAVCVDETDDQVTPLPSGVDHKLHTHRPQTAFRISTTEEGLDDYIKMNPVSNSATLPALSHRQPPDFSRENDRVCKSFNGRFGILEDPS